MIDSEGITYRTPCTVPDLPAGEHQLIFRRQGSPDLTIGRVDFATTREIEARW